MKLVTARMSTEIVMVIEDENAPFGTKSSLVEPCGSEARDPGTHDHQVVLFADLSGWNGKIRIPPLTNPLERSDCRRDVPAKTREKRRVSRASGLRVQIS